MSKAYDGGESPSSTVAEIAAALLAFEFSAELCNHLSMQSFETPFAVTVLSDNLEVCKTVGGEQLPSRYFRLWGAIDTAREALDEADVGNLVVKVQAHKNIWGNEKADRLAKRASKRLGKGGRIRAKKHTLIRCLLPGCGGGEGMKTVKDLVEHFCEFHCDREADDELSCALCSRKFSSFKRLQKHYDEDHEAVYSDDEESSEESDEDEYTDYSDDDYSTDEDEEDSDAEADDSEEEEEESEDDEEEEAEDEGEDSCGSCCYYGTTTDENDDTDTDTTTTDLSTGTTTTASSTNTTMTTNTTTTTTTSGTDNEEEEEVYECCYGDFVTSCLNEMKDHWYNKYGVQTNGDVLECDYCNIVFPNEADRKTHILQWHGVGK